MRDVRSIKVTVATLQQFWDQSSVVEPEPSAEIKFPPGTGITNCGCGSSSGPFYLPKT
jgi:hypothetical protein